MTAVAKQWPVPLAVLLAAALGQRATELNPRLIAFVLLALVSAIASLSRPRALLFVAMAWLPLSGHFRRFTGVYEEGSADILLLIGPACLAILVLSSLWTQPRSTPLSKAIFFMELVLLVSLLNPEGGGLTGALSGLLLAIAPTLWFWVGRVMLDRRLFRGLLLLVSVLAVIVGLYGLKQTFWGFSPTELQWVQSRVSFQSLRVFGHLRPFSTFSAFTDYSLFLGLGLVVASTRLIPRGMRLVVVVVCSPAIVLASNRLALLMTLFSIGLVLLLRARMRPVAAGVFAAVVILGAAGLATVIANAGLDRSDGVSSLLFHQVAGFANPFDAQYSTLDAHTEIVSAGLGELTRSPLGLGAGVITRSGAEFFNTEWDLSNMAVAAGFPGLIAYLLLVAAVYRLARNRVMADRGDPMVGAAVAIAVLGFGNWFVGGNYGFVAWPWLALGFLDRESVQALVSKPRDLQQQPELSAQ